MNKYVESNFKGCQFNPLAGRPLLEVFPVLEEIIAEEMRQSEDLDGLLRYIIMVYDPKSPLVNNERDLNFRKGIAAELSGLPIDADRIQAVYACTYPGLAELICKFLVRFIKSKEWAAICAYEYKFWEAIRLLMQPIATDKSDREQLDAANKKDVLSASIDEGLTKLDAYYRSFFGEDDQLEKRAKKRVSPELMAEKHKVF